MKPRGKALVLVVLCSVVFATVLLATLGPKALKKANAKRLIAEQLIDPSSARFRNMRVSPDGAVVCGEMNGKNRLGAYVGFHKFWVRNGELGRVEPPANAISFDQLTWAHQWGLCDGFDLVGSLTK